LDIWISPFCESFHPFVQQPQIIRRRDHLIERINIMGNPSEQAKEILDRMDSRSRARPKTSQSHHLIARSVFKYRIRASVLKSVTSSFALPIASGRWC
jgi:hypothetical protein